MLFRLCRRLQEGSYSVEVPPAAEAAGRFGRHLHTQFPWIACPHVPALVLMAMRPGAVVAAELAALRQLALHAYDWRSPLARLTADSVWAVMANVSNSLGHIRSRQRWLLPLPEAVALSAAPGNVRLMAPISMVARGMFGASEIRRVGWLVRPLMRTRLMHALNGNGRIDCTVGEPSCGSAALAATA